MAFVTSLGGVASSLFLGTVVTSRTIPSRRQRCARRSITQFPTCPGRCVIQACSTSTDVDRKQALFKALSTVIDPDLGQDIVTLGFIKDVEFSEVPGLKGMYDVSFKVELTTPACPVKDIFKSDCKRLAEDISFVGKANVIMTAAPPSANVPTPTGALDNIGAIVAVASCKGGVGKSTTAVNLAFSLASRGARVGIMDADIYGPSLPTLVEPEERAVQFKDGRIRPLEAHGVKLMSFGYVNPDSAIMRGPMIANVLNQLLTTTEWGVLDYLVIDLPPGTGDVQLTLSQIINMTAAVIVTTPQKLSFVDVVKGIDMFDKVSVPSVAVVENMSYFVAPDTGVKHHIFGKGHQQRLIEQYGITDSFSMPIDPELSEKSDSGIPYVVANPKSMLSDEYQRLASAVVQEVAKIQYGGLGIPDFQWDEASGNINVRMPNTETTQKIWPATLRRQCRCALCVDEMTGAQKLDPADVSDDVRPMKLAPVGNYALDVLWSDGHPSLYPYSRFVENWRNSKDMTEETNATQKNSPVEVSAGGS